MRVRGGCVCGFVAAFVADGTRSEVHDIGNKVVWERLIAVRKLVTRAEYNEVNGNGGFVVCVKNIDVSKIESHVYFHPF